MAVECDVSDEASVDRAVARSIERFGGISILINNAGKHLLEYAVPPTTLPRDKWRRLLDVNVIGIVNASAAAWPTSPASSASSARTTPRSLPERHW